MSLSLAPSSGDSTGDSLDRLLREFYRQEMPASFPALPLPNAASQVSSPARRPVSSVFRSRIVLAISVAVVALGCVFALARRGELTQRPTGDPANSTARPQFPIGNK